MTDTNILRPPREGERETAVVQNTWAIDPLTQEDMAREARALSADRAAWTDGNEGSGYGTKLADPIAAELAEAERQRLAGPRRSSVVDHLDFPLRPWVAEPPLVSLVDGPLDSAGVRYAALIERKNATVNVSASGAVHYGVNVPPVAKRVTL